MSGKYPNQIFTPQEVRLLHKELVSIVKKAERVLDIDTSPPGQIKITVRSTRILRDMSLILENVMREPRVTDEEIRRMDELERARTVRDEGIRERQLRT
jgi:hypothetical protein